MNSPILLSGADQSRLEELLKHQLPPPFPDADQKRQLEQILSTVHSGYPAMLCKNHAGLHDRITLQSPRDPRDNFTFSIVMPREADVDADRISILAPLCLAVLGRGRGAMVEWDAPAGRREMRIHLIGKEWERGVTEPDGELSLEMNLSGHGAG